MCDRHCHKQVSILCSTTVTALGLVRPQLLLRLAHPNSEQVEIVSLYIIHQNPTSRGDSSSCKARQALASIGRTSYEFCFIFTFCNAHFIADSMFFWFVILFEKIDLLKFSPQWHKQFILLLFVNCSFHGSIHALYYGKFNVVIQKIMIDTVYYLR